MNWNQHRPPYILYDQDQIFVCMKKGTKEIVTKYHWLEQQSKSRPLELESKHTVQPGLVTPYRKHWNSDIHD